MASVAISGRSSFLRSSSPALVLVFALSCVSPKEHAPVAQPESAAEAPEASAAGASDTKPDPSVAAASEPKAEPSSAPAAETPPAAKPDGQEQEVWPTGKPKPVPPPVPVDKQEPEVWPTDKPKPPADAQQAQVPPAAKPVVEEPEVWPTKKPKVEAPPALPASEPAPAATPSAWTATDSGLAIHGTLSSQYRGRWANSQHDNDLYEFLAVDFGDANVDKWTAHLQARMSIDLDGTPPSSTPPIFFSLADTYDSAVHTQLYEAHVDGTDIGPLEVLKLGRQTDYQTPVFAWFDGAYATSKPIGKSNLQFGAYGGVPVYLYESSTSGDVMAGAFAESKLWPEAKARIDWMHLEDTTQTGYHNDNLWSLGLWQDFGQRVHVEGTYTRLNEHNRDYGVRATWNQPEADLVVQASFYQLLEGQKALALPIDPFYSSLGELFPYYDAQLLVSKALGTKVNLQGGVGARRVTDEANLGDFNHDFERYFLTAVMSDVLPSELVLSVTGELWDGGSTGIASCGADLSRSFNTKWDTSIGTFYSLYKTDLFATEERDNVRTYYLRLRYRQGPALSWDLRYEYESDDPGPFNSLILGVVWQF